MLIECSLIDAIDSGVKCFVVAGLILGLIDLMYDFLSLMFLNSTKDL